MMEKLLLSNGGKILKKKHDCDLDKMIDNHSVDVFDKSNYISTLSLKIIAIELN